MTGRSMNRPGWNRLEADIDAGEITTLVVWRLDRLGRTASGLTMPFEKLQSRQVYFVSIWDAIDLSHPTVYTILAEERWAPKPKHFRSGCRRMKTNGRDERI
jgi:DNA invertase Pin-like site-specific DNA recombinase